MTLVRLLILDDNVEICDWVRDVAGQKAFDVTAVQEFDEFRSLYLSAPASLIILDLQMPKVDGIEVLRFLAGERSNAQIVLMSGMDARIIGSAMQLGKARGLNMLGVLQKPILLSDLEAMLEAAKREARPIGESELREAIEKGQLLAHYQPVVAVKSYPSGTIKSVEALARWQHPEFDLVMPDAFIPMAEETDLIASLTDVVLRLSLGEAAKWHKQGYPVSVAVNMAPQLLSDLEFPDRLGNLLSEFGVQPSALVLEVTERAAMTEVSQTMDVLTRLRLKGVGLSIDDFGTGFSSLVDLYRLPYSQVKIDRSFVQELDNVDTAEEAKVIIRSVVDLAHNLRLDVCAEGVESESALRFLLSVGCDKAQGYHFSRPVPANQLYDMLTSSGAGRPKSSDEAPPPGKGQRKRLAPISDG